MLLVAVPLAPLLLQAAASPPPSSPLLWLTLYSTTHTCAHLLSIHFDGTTPTSFLSTPLLSSFMELWPSISQPLYPVAS